MPLDAIRDLDAIAYVPCLNLRHGRRRSGRLISSCPVSAPRGSSRSFLFVPFLLRTKRALTVRRTRAFSQVPALPGAPALRPVRAD